MKIYLAFSVHISFMLQQFLSNFKMASFSAHMQSSTAGLVSRKEGKQVTQVLTAPQCFAEKTRIFNNYSTSARWT